MHLPSKPVPVIGDATQLHQVVMNLCVNALHAMEGTGGKLTVTLAETDVEAGRVFQHGTLAAGPHAALTVEDSGQGMNEATLGRIFEPFFTTRDAGKGTGLGLALVFAIVTGAGGAIDVRSELGRGSAFTIHFRGSRQGRLRATSSIADPGRLGFEPRQVRRGLLDLLLVQRRRDRGHRAGGLRQKTHDHELGRADPERGHGERQQGEVGRAQ